MPNGESSILGIITARGGSKRVPRKNVKEFCGKPLLAWTIEVGRSSGVFDRFILSTDDEEIAAVGKEHGIEVPFRRPSELATDTASSFVVVAHALQWLSDRGGYAPTWVVLLEPSSPGRLPGHIQEVARHLRTRDDVDSIVGITQTPGHLSYAKQLECDARGFVSHVGDHTLLKNLVHRNQDLPVSYFINSSIYAFKATNVFDGNKSLWGERTLGYIMDEQYAMDIDTPEDWVVAVAKMKRLLASHDLDQDTHC